MEIHMLILTISVLVLGCAGYYGHRLWAHSDAAGITNRNMKRVLLLSIIMLLSASAFAQAPRHRHHRRHHHPHQPVIIVR
jgi:hypothetical protein